MRGDHNLHVLRSVTQEVEDRLQCSRVDRRLGLLDRDGLRPEAPDRIDTLLALPAALGLAVG